MVKKNPPRNAAGGTNHGPWLARRVPAQWINPAPEY